MCREKNCQPVTAALCVCVRVCVVRLHVCRHWNSLEAKIDASCRARRAGCDMDTANGIYAVSSALMMGNATRARDAVLQGSN